MSFLLIDCMFWLDCFCICVGITYSTNGLLRVFMCVQLSGGPVDGLVEALQSLGVSEGVRLLTASQPREDKQSSGTDSHSDRETGHL